MTVTLSFKTSQKWKKKTEPKVIAKAMEKFLTFSIKNLHFKDSLQFLNSSLDTLVDNLRSKQKSGKTLQELFPNLFNYFKSEWGHLPEEDFELLTRKGVYPYQFMDSHEKFKMKELPSRFCFYNSSYERLVLKQRIPLLRRWISTCQNY